MIQVMCICLYTHALCCWAINVLIRCLTKFDPIWKTSHYPVWKLIIYAYDSYSFSERPFLMKTLVYFVASYENDRIWDIDPFSIWKKRFISFLKCKNMHTSDSGLEQKLKFRPRFRMIFCTQSAQSIQQKQNKVNFFYL